jgi:carbamate kinase
MGPKVRAACGFVNKTGKRAGIGALRDASALIEGAAGTIISADAGQLDDPGWQHGRMITRLQPRR